MPDAKLLAALKSQLEKDGTSVSDLHVWRLGPGHLGAIISVSPPGVDSAVMLVMNEEYYRRRIRGFKALSHVTIEVQRPFLLL